MVNQQFNPVEQLQESKSAKYESCDAYWLLVVVDGIDSAQEQEIRIDPRINSCVFEKIIVFHTFGYIVEVDTA